MNDAGVVGGTGFIDFGFVNVHVVFIGEGVHGESGFFVKAFQFSELFFESMEFRGVPGG